MGIWNSDHDKDGEGKICAPPVKPVTEISETDLDIIEHWGSIESALGSGSKVEGKFLFDRPVQLDGVLKGEVQAPNALVVIGPTGTAEAKIEAAMIIVMGTVEGSLKATEKIEILSNGTVNGDLNSPRIVLQDGCIFNGNCTMGGAQPDVKDIAPIDEEKNTTSKLIVTLGEPEATAH